MISRARHAFALGACLLVAAVARAAAATPGPTPVGGDPRSAGEGPGLVGEPLLAVLGVVAIALLAVVATTAWVRLTASRSEERESSRR